MTPDNDNFIRSYNNPRQEEKFSYLDFPKALFSYISLRLTQFFRVTFVFLGLSLSFLAGTKGVVVRKMYWGRTSFYKTAFQAIVVFVTAGALLASINARADIFAEQEEGVIASSGIIGNNDLFLQVGTADAITEAQVSSVDYEIIKYTVKSGDTLAAIAKKFGISTDTIRWANNIPSGRDTITVGKVLKIPPMDGILYAVKSGDTLDTIIGKVKNANKFDLIELNNLQPPNYAVTIGQQLFIPNAEYKPTPVATKTYTSYGASYVNTPSTASKVAPGTFVNPMQQCGAYRFLRGYRYSHTGVDLAGPAGCPIVSAGGGTVYKAGWCGSMGFCVAIRHYNGYSTLYMHGNGVFYVRSGQTVGAGQRIMQEGNTGYSFGAHLHLSLAAPGVDVLNNYHGRMNPYGIIPY